MNIKKIFSITVAVALMCSLAACGGGTSSGESSTSPGPSGNGGDAGNLSPGPDSTPGGGPTSQPPSASPGASPSDAPPSSGNGEASAPPSDTPPPSGNGSSGAGLSGTAAEILAKLIDDITASDVWIPMSMPPMPAPQELRHNAIGLTDDDYARYVEADAQSMAGINTQAHQIVVYQCVDSSAAGQVKRLVSSDGGYDPLKWICAWPERVVVVDSGNYVLLVASYNDVVDIAIELFREAAGSIGEVVTFYEGVT